MEWLSKPVTVSADEHGPASLEDCGDLISPQLQDALRKCDYTHLFPVQLALIKNFQSFRDYGVLAPTGSGKTLSYMIPILNELCKRRIVRLRALIIVPTRVLVLQTHKVLSDIIGAMEGCDLRVGCATGKTSLSREQSKLMNASEKRSRVDILICTPGRLVEHLRCTKEFTLRDVKFLIIDEADRLLEQAYQDWLQLVLEATDMDARLPNPFGGPLEDIRWRRHYQLRKIILSASLTKQPAQLMHLHLNNPLLIKVSSGVADSPHVGLPSALSHCHIVVPAGKKPLAMLYLLKQQVSSGYLCFTGSSQSAAKLAKFLKSAGFNCAFITAETDANVTQLILADFADGRCDILVASDGLSRGVDLPQVTAVVNYDCPPTASLYIHRAGRTARAGRSGTCYTILSPNEAIHFKTNVFSASRRIRPKSTVLQELAPIAEEALNSKCQ